MTLTRRKSWSTFTAQQAEAQRAGQHHVPPARRNCAVMREGRQSAQQPRRLLSGCGDWNQLATPAVATSP
eukprot:6886282-Prymnesium_polylepis.1